MDEKQLNSELSKLIGNLEGENKRQAQSIQSGLKNVMDEAKNKRTITTPKSDSTVQNLYKASLLQNEAPSTIDYGTQFMEQVGSSLNAGESVLGAMMGAFGNLLENATAQYLQQQSYLLSEINKDLGLTGELSEDFREEITLAAAELELLGISFGEVVAASKALVEESGRFALVGSDMLQRAGEIAGAYGLKMSEVIESYTAFERVGYGASAAQESIADAGKRSLELGLQSRTTIRGITDNIEKLNQYGFAEGVEGLEKMVRRSTELRMNLDDVFTVADKVFSPEGALELSAELQAIGSAFGDFNDPLRLMYMATNEVEGLGDAIGQMTEHLATYNEETGQFEVTGLQLREARAMYEATGVSIETLTRSAIAAQERMQASQMMAGLGLTEEQEEFLTNISRMKDGKMSVELLSPELRAEFDGATAISLDKIDSSTAELLMKYQEQFQEMSEGDMITKQVTLTENIARDINYLVAITRLQAANVGDQVIEALVGEDYKSFGQEAATFLRGNVQDIAEAIKENGGSVASAVEKVFEKEKQQKEEQIKQQNQPQKVVQETTVNVKTDQLLQKWQKEWSLNPEQWTSGKGYLSQN